MTFSVRTVMMIARKNVETTAKKKLAVTSIVARRVDERDRLVRDLGHDPVDRRDQQVDPERRADAGEAGRQTGQRVPAHAVEGGRRQRDQDQVAGVGGDARQDADQHDDERDQAAAARPGPAAG